MEYQLYLAEIGKYVFTIYFTRNCNFESKSTKEKMVINNFPYDVHACK